MSVYRRSIFALSALLVLTTVVCLNAGAQFRMNRVVSPELLPDNQVTFRLFAPNASSVTVRGDWMSMGASGEMTKNDTGLWVLTLGPLSPEFYGYTFNVDGVTVLDPSNARIKRDGFRNASVLLVPGKESELYEVQDVPHGILAKVWYDSPTLNLKRRMYVYTPPGYENGTDSYPVLYLFHGAGGDEDAWTTLGRAPEILDNLIASGKAKPMIVVMTNGNPGQAAMPGAAPAMAAEEAPGMGGPGNMAAGRFEASLVNDVVPYIEDHYRVLTDKNNRAIAGLSMGGAQTQNITNDNPGMFGYIGVFSMGIMNFGGNVDTAQREEKMTALKNSGVNLYWIGVGQDDFLFESVQTLLATMDKIDFEHTYRESTGGHSWNNWRIYLSEFAPLLFK